MKHITTRIAFSLVLCTTLLASCKKETPDPIISNTNSTTTSTTTLLCGTVSDRNGLPLQGASIVAGSSTTSTDVNGYFSFSNYACPERCYVHSVKSGYFDGSVGVLSVENGVTNVAITMMDNTPDFIITPTTSQNLLLSNGAGIVLQGMSVDAGNGSAYTGQLNVAVFHHDPSAADFAATIPGGDLIGSDLSGATSQLFSYGMLSVRMTNSAGDEMQLLSGSTASVSMPVPASMLGNAPATIPLWHFNETTGIWIEEGSATLTGNSYVGNVTHFSSWNCDVPGDRATVTGRVLDCNNQPVGGVQVNIGQGSATTDVNGNFERFVPTNLSFDIQVNQPELGLVSSSLNVGSIGNGESFAAGDLHVACPGYIGGSVTCNLVGGVSGYASVNSGGLTLNTPINAAGNFLIAVPINGATATLTMIGLNHGIILSANVTLPTAAGQTVNAGTFDLCGNGTSGTLTTTFNITGDGFNNTPFNITVVPAVASIFYNITDAVTYGFSSDGTNLLSVSFPAASTGTWNTVDEDAIIGLTLSGNSWVSDNATITITQFGAVGTIVTGTFSGTFQRFNGVDIVNATVTGGNFQLLRTPDEQ